MKNCLLHADWSTAFKAAYFYSVLNDYLGRAMDKHKKFRAVLEYDPEDGVSFSLETPEGQPLLEGAEIGPADLLPPRQVVRLEVVRKQETKSDRTP